MEKFKLSQVGRSLYPLPSPDGKKRSWVLQITNNSAHLIASLSVYYSDGAPNAAPVAETLKNIGLHQMLAIKLAAVENERRLRIERVKCWLHDDPTRYGEIISPTRHLFIDAKQKLFDCRDLLFGVHRPAPKVASLAAKRDENEPCR